MTTPIEKLREYGYELPRPGAPVATYIPVTRTGNIIYISGQISRTEDGPVTGRLGDTMNVVQGGNAAELAALGVLAQIVYGAGVELTANRQHAAGDLRAAAGHIAANARECEPCAAATGRGRAPARQYEIDDERSCRSERDAEHEPRRATLAAHAKLVERCVVT